MIKTKPKPSLPTTSRTVSGTSGPTIVKPESVSSSSAPKAPSIDDSYSAFLEDMKALGALDGWDYGVAESHYGECVHREDCLFYVQPTTHGLTHFFCHDDKAFKTL